MEVDTSEKVKQNKSKPRCRMKKLLNSVQELMDFYFSDVNLNHDRFLRKEIENNPGGYVDLSTMLKFNKLKQLKADTAMLAKAIENSSSLMLSEDHLKVRRKDELREIENTDDRTVYVEEFPLTTDHDWLKSVFSTCGTVEYISLPKFRFNNQVKGFAFIEFSTPEEAQHACQVLNTIRSRNKKRISTDGRSSEDESTKKKNRKRRSTSECDPQRTMNQQNTKRRRSISESSDGSPVKANRRKRQSSLCSEEEVEESTNKSEKTVNFNTQCEVLTSPKKQRSVDQGHISVNISNELTSVTQESGVPSSDAITTKSSINRKRKSSESKDSQNKVKTVTEKEYDSKGSIPLNPKTHAKKDIKSKDGDAPDRDNNSHRKINFHESVCNPVHKSSDDSGNVTLYNKNVSIEVKPVHPSGKDDLPTSDHKRKASLTSDRPQCLSPQKKVKLEEICSNEEIINKDCSNETNVITTSQVKEESDAKEEVASKKKKNRQHKKKADKVADPVSIPPLHVITKCEWLMLKKEYKRVQRIKMSELKRNLKVLKSEKVRRVELKGRIVETVTAKNGDTKTGDENMDGEHNKHVEDDEKENFIESKKSLKMESEEIGIVKNVDVKSKGLNMLPGTVVAMKTSSENLTRKDIKTALAGFAQVVYVDYVDGVYQGFIRFSCSDDVEKVITAESGDKQSWPFQLRKLSCDEENEYFRKAEEDRLKKYNKDQRKKRKKERGVEKITRDVEMVTNHIHFT